MRNPFAKGVGGVLSADIAVPEYERQLDFYRSILTTGDAPLWRDDLMNNQGTPVIGLGAQTAEYDSLPLQWMPHFQVADVAASAAYAMRKGGQQLYHSQADDGQSQWAVLVDPAGAAFGIIPVVEDETESTADDERLGRISWLSLTVPDAAAIQEFYEHVVGWNARSTEANGGDGHSADREMLRSGEIAAAEICQLRDRNQDIPPVWLMHLPVDDLAESLRRVVAGKGQIVQNDAATNYTVIRDPVGVYFALQAGSSAS